jgi:hypothetical protein
MMGMIPPYRVKIVNGNDNEVADEFEYRMAA